MTKYPILCSLAVLLVTVGGASGQSCGTAACYPQYKPIVTAVKTIVKEVPFYQKFVAVAPLVELPTYSSVYVAPVVPTVAPAAPVAVAPAAPPPDATQQILAMLQGMNGKLDMVAARQNDQERRLQELERIVRGSPPPSSAPTGPAPQPQQAPTAPQKNVGGPATGVNPDVAAKALVFYKKSCAACHAADKAAELGGNFTLINADGSKVKLTSRQAARMVSKVYKNEMPPPNNVHKIPEATNDEVGLVVADNPQ